MGRPACGKALLRVIITGEEEMKKIIALILCVVMVAFVFAACAAEEAAQEAAEETQEAAEETAEEPADDGDDWESDEGSAAAAVDMAIAAIQVQEWTPETEQLCKDAKDAWEACPEEMRDQIEEYDYFGLDTGDASLDDPLNQDDISENEILVVSFGTSFNDSRVKDIGGIEKAIAAAYPDWSVRRAFTAQIIINHILARDGESIDNVDQALQRAVDNGVKNLVVQPTHLMHGAEYDELIGVLDGYLDKFESVGVAEPLLGEVGSDATVINDDKKAVAELVVAAAAENIEYDSIKAMDEKSIALVLMGHGTSHTANVTYNQMQTQMDELGYKNVFIGTVEGEPEETEVNNVIAKVKEAGYKQVVLRPLMVVAGDHANNDMADDEDEESWYSKFAAEDAFTSVGCDIQGLGRIPGIEDLYVKHTAAAMGAADEVPVSEDGAAAAGELADGTYSADFNTDSSMFHVNETLDNKGVLTVKDGKMTIHVSLVSKNILNLFPGLAADAEKAGAVLLEPTEDEVTYSDGTTETVYGFDIPVEKIGEDFDLAIIGTKGKWYDHKVSVTDPEPV